ncbi:unnamed protein product [Moneuplotes crassus]|uniref:Calcineurin-like phosphoesterase domain-containing protein n=1 Tax=Euplotes crassus TaxID=5936 RepID=A0AAD1X5G1_EUPCR|nr:unnamed protein product [Moneuplotes crassus]
MLWKRNDKRGYTKLNRKEDNGDIKFVVAWVICELMFVYSVWCVCVNLASHGFVERTVSGFICILVVLFGLLKILEVKIGLVVESKISLARFFVIPIFLSLGITMTCTGYCECIFNTTVFQHTPGVDSHATTAYERRDLHKICTPSSRVCMVYPTLPSNAGNEVFINFHINPESCEANKCAPIFRYQRYSHGKNNSNWENGTPILGEYELPSSEYTSRDIYTVYLENLEQSSTYRFMIDEPSWKDYQPQIYSYKTFDPENYRIIAAGDIGNQEKAIEMNTNTVSNLEFDLIMVGGDIAYDNNIPTCFYVWDHLLHNIPYGKYDSITNSTRLAAFIMGVGNHDVGVSSFSNGGIPHNAHQPVYKHWFPQQSSVNEVPFLEERKTYFSHSFGDKLLIISLDTQYEVDMDGEQAHWLEETLKNSNHKIKIAQYHGPIYPSCEPEDTHDYWVEDAGKKYWVPLFDKYNVTLVSENHTHSVKRTKKLKGGKEDQTGTVYIGEGNWGCYIHDIGCIDRNPDLQLFSTIDRNIWLIHLGSNLDLKAYNEKNKILDESVVEY